jgi:hypothetical protein
VGGRGGIEIAEGPEGELAAADNDSDHEHVRCDRAKPAGQFTRWKEKKMIGFWKQLWEDIFTRPHIHRWKGSCWNSYGVTSEKSCSCGKRIHLATFRELWVNDWSHYREGPHPLAEEMREKGEIKNY